MGIQRRRHDSNPVLAALPVANNQLAPVKQQVLHPQPQGLHQAKAGSVQQVRNQPVRTVQLGQDRPDLRPAEDHRQAPGGGRPGDIVKPRQLDAQDIPVKKQQSLQGLVLGGRADLAIHRQMGQELLHARRPEVPRMSPMVKRHVPPDPLQVRLLGTVCQMPDPHPAPRHLQQPGTLRRHAPYPSTVPAHRSPGRHEWKQGPARTSSYISGQSDGIYPVTSSPYF